MLKAFDIPPEAMTELLDMVRSGGMMADAGLSPVLRHLVKDYHAKSWFITAFSDGTKACETFAGSRRGESWADTVYAFVFGRLLTIVAEQATGEDLLTELEVDMTAGIFGNGKGEPIGARDGTCADDMAYPLSDPDPDRLLRKTARLSSILLTVCESHGVKPNLKKGKNCDPPPCCGARGQACQTEVLPRWQAASLAPGHGGEYWSHGSTYTPRWCPRLPRDDATGEQVEASHCNLGL